jgi:hypothetical protein
MRKWLTLLALGLLLLALAKRAGLHLYPIFGWLVKAFPLLIIGLLIFTWWRKKS